MGATLLSTMYLSEPSIPAVDTVCVDSVTTQSIVAAGAIAPAHSTSRSDSPSSPLTRPGSGPFKITFNCPGEYAGKPKTDQKFVTSCTLILLCPTMAMLCPLPVDPPGLL